MEIVFLGTSCMAPTKDRNVQGIYLSYKAEGILIDCGEGTQRQMNLAGINRNKVTMILITHWHGDHVGGIIGLLQTISDKENPPNIEIFGPKGTKKHIQHLLDSVIFDNSNLDLQITELNPSKVETFKEKDDFYLQCAPMDHTTPCVAYSFIENDIRKVNMTKAKSFGLKEGPELGKLQNGKTIFVNDKKVCPDDVSSIKKGRKISFVFDTRPNKNAYDLALEADILVTEAVYLPDLKDNAEKYKHMTTEDSALIANNANVKRLIATHFSQRYKTIDDLEEDLKTRFANSSCAYDFMKVKL